MVALLLLNGPRRVGGALRVDRHDLIPLVHSCTTILVQRAETTLPY